MRTINQHRKATMSSVSAKDAKSLVGQNYPQGCSGLVCQLLNKPWKSANSFKKGAAIGANGKYTGVSAGDIIGFPGHVGVYIGDAKCMFVDVPGPGKDARCLMSYGAQQVYKYSY